MLRETSPLDGEERIVRGNCGYWEWIELTQVVFSSGTGEHTKLHIH
jgi:hypothetical protein